MKERPILFSAPMVRGILEDRKIHTRRVIKPQPSWDAEVRQTRSTGPFAWPIGSLGQQCGLPIFTDGRRDGEFKISNPYGAPGDRLWVRETFRLPAQFDGNKPLDVKENVKIWYEANGEPRTEGAPFGKKRAAIHMPRFRSRITLEITEVRVERLQDCSEADALAEGVPHGFDHHPIAEVHSEAEGRAYCRQCGGWGTHGALGSNLGVIEVDCAECDTPQKLYRNLWEHINGDGSWAANPFVWVVAFRRVGQEAARAA